MKSIFFLFCIFPFVLISQEYLITGTVVDEVSGEPLSGVEVTFINQELKSITNKEGQFKISAVSIPISAFLQIRKEGFEIKRIELTPNNSETIELGIISLTHLWSDKNQSIISISDENLNSEDDNLTNNVSGLLSSSRDVFFNAAAFDFSATFYRPRGFDNAYGKVLINGIELNKLHHGRPQWSNWGGLNDVQRNQQYTIGTQANDYTFGDLAGVNHITMRPSMNRKGGRVSYASSNRSYQGRIMASYNTGILKKGWAFTALVSRRYANQGYIDGTLYDANSFYLGVEKIFKNHSLTFSSIYAENRRGRSTAITEEIYNLKGRKYNPHWGYVDGTFRNSRMREIVEPILMLNHNWDLSEKTKINTNIAYQFGKRGSTRIDNGGTRLVPFGDGNTYIGGARNPGPEYYQNLPSYYLRFSNPTPYDFQQAYLAEQSFINDGQFNWDKLYDANILSTQNGHNAIYALQEDRIDDRQFFLNSNINSQITEKIRLTAAINYRNLHSSNYAKLKELLGANGFLDVDFFAEEGLDNQNLEDVAQSNLKTPNRIAKEGEKYKYNYTINAQIAEAYTQGVIKLNVFDFYFGLGFTQTNYQRNGLYENGYYPGQDSFGKSEKLQFNDFKIKGGITAKISGKHYLQFNANYFSKAPTIRNSFNNARQNNFTVDGLESEQILYADANYIYRGGWLNARITPFVAQFSKGTDINFFFTEGIAAFVQEVATNIKRQNLGLELGVEAQVLPTLKLKAAASFGQNIYTNNPNIYYSSDDFQENLTFGSGKTYLKNFHVAGGPEQAYQLGLEYRDPDFWNIGITTNYYSHAFSDISFLKRSDAFYLDLDTVDEATFNKGGRIIALPINDYKPELGKELIRQERFEDYTLVNVIGGKSWKVKNYFVGFFATINNVLDKFYRTGGFEQSRRIGYRDQLVEQSQPYGALFGNRYFYGRGATYYLNVYVRF